MTPQEAKHLIKDLGFTGVEFSALMGKTRSYVSDFNRDGVPENIAIILNLATELKIKKVSKKRISKIIDISRENP